MAPNAVTQITILRIAPGYVRSSSGSLAISTAILRASSLVSSFAGRAPPRNRQMPISDRRCRTHRSTPLVPRRSRAAKNGARSTCAYLFRRFDALGYASRRRKAAVLECALDHAPSPSLRSLRMNITDGRKLSQAWKTASTIAHDKARIQFFDSPGRPEAAFGELCHGHECCSHSGKAGGLYEPAAGSLGFW